MTVAPGPSPMARCFEALRAQGRCALMPFLTAGDPDLATTGQVLLALQAAGADLVELGIPYSDPLADGPVIQAAASRALRTGTTPGAVMQMLSELRGQLTLPVVLFTYSNPLPYRGMERFGQEPAAAGAAGLRAPDLPPEVAARLPPSPAVAAVEMVVVVLHRTPK